jgi:hypothetical protein
MTEKEKPSKGTTNATPQNGAPKNSKHESETPSGAFTDGMKKGLGDPNEERKGRLKEAIRTHARNNRKVVKAKRGGR